MRRVPVVGLSVDSFRKSSPVRVISSRASQGTPSRIGAYPFSADDALNKSRQRKGGRQ